MTKKPYGTSGMAANVFRALRDNIADPSGMSCSQLRDMIGVEPKRLSCVLAEAVHRELIGIIKRHPYSRYYVSQAMADQCIESAMEAMHVERTARNPRIAELTAEICGAFSSGSELLLFGELISRLSGSRVYMSRMIGRLISVGALHSYGPPMAHRYSSEPFDDAKRAAVDAAVALEIIARKQRKAEYQRARLLASRPEGKPIRKTSEGRATRLKPKACPKTAQQLGMRPAKDQPTGNTIRSAAVVIPPDVRRIVVAAPVDYRYHVDPSHRGEFSQQWQQLRSAA